MEKKIYRQQDTHTRKAISEIRERERESAQTQSVNMKQTNQTKHTVVQARSLINNQEQLVYRSIRGHKINIKRSV